MESARKFFILAEHITDFPCTDTDISGRYIRVRTDVFVYFIHEALAKAHHFLVRFTLWIKIRSTFSTAKRLFGQGVFENLVEPEKLHDTCGDRWVKPQSAFIWTESIVELDPITSVHLP